MTAAKRKKQGKSAKSKSTKGRVVSAANVESSRIAYDRDRINLAVAANREAGITRLYPNHGKYVKATSASADARAVYDNGDGVAEMLRNVPLESLWTVAAKHLDAKVLKQKRELYEGKNIGMVRMNIGNLIRGAIRRKEAEKRLAAAKPKSAK